VAASRPQAPALKVPRGRTRGGDIDYLELSFAGLDAEVNAWCAHLAARGVARGDRALVMVRPGLPLIASVFALFRIGAIPVVIDPGMQLGSFLACVARTRPRVLVGIPLARFVSRLFRRTFSTLEVRVPASASLTARLAAARGAPPAFETVASAAGDLAAILFTSGSTGSPKGVRYEHGMFDAQVRLIREAYGIAEGEIDLPLLPVFALFNPALGMTTVVPEVDPRRPAAADPAGIVQAIRQEGVTNSFGSPTLWRIVANHCLARGISLPSLRRVLCAGAPVPAALWTDARRLLPNGRLHSPYGATEALPVTSISDDIVARLATLPPPTSILQPPTGAGAPVGLPLPGVRVKIIAISEETLPSLDDALELPAGEIGEIIANGPAVTREYDGLPEATLRAGICDRSGAFWHRMGDCGMVDSSGSLWFCGRVAERVLTASGPMYTEPCEQVFRSHPRVPRCALIGLGAPGNQVPSLVVEARVPGPADARALAGELLALARSRPATAAIARIYFKPFFPVDVRHNAKIHRRTLAKWAARVIGYGPGPILP
jgi:acyl-CoA synthetase (AMP-forming)/AMP-acid ligase II